jgi:hypothetical protein
VSRDLTAWTLEKVAVLGADQVVGEVGDGTAAQRPAIQTQRRAAVPVRPGCAVVTHRCETRWCSTPPSTPASQPTVTNLYSGLTRHPTSLAEFLMRNNGFGCG